MTGTRQGGSILNFIIVAVVLGGLLVAGIYIVRQVTQSDSLPEEGIAATEEKDNEKSQQPMDEPEEPVQQLPGTVEGSTDELPQTGPVEAIGGALAVGMLSLATVHYVRSRRIQLSL